MSAVTPLDFLRSHARRLHRAAIAGDGEARARLRALPDLRPLDDAALAVAARRRHALAAIARELGYAGWAAAEASLSGASRDFGTLLYPERGATFWNIWSADYDEAASIRSRHGGYLMGYREQYFISDRHLIEHLGLDPDDADWDRIGRDWIAPADTAARDRLWLKRLQRFFGAAGGRDVDAG